MNISLSSCLAVLTVLPLCSSGPSNEEIRPEPSGSSGPTTASDDWSRVAFTSSKAGVRAQFDFGDHAVLPFSSVGQPLTDGPAVVVNQSGIYVDGAKVIQLREGRPEGPEDEAIAAISSALADLEWGDKRPSPLAIFADRDLLFRSLGLVVRATAPTVPHFLLVVKGDDEEVRGLEFDRPRLNAKQQLDVGSDESYLAVDVGGHSSVRIGVRTAETGKGSAWLERLPLSEGNSADQRRLENLASTLADQFSGDTKDRRALIAFEDNASAQRVAAVLAAINGPNCQGSPPTAARCFFPRRTLFAHAINIFDGRIINPADTSACEGLDKDGIRCSIKANMNTIRSCYDDGASDMAQGRLTVKLRIDGSTGEVESASIVEDTLGIESTRTCLLEKVREITFPSDPERGAVVVTYPLEFRKG